MRVNLLLVADLILFFLFPLAFWEVSREIIGEYPAMLLSTLPGILYSLYRFNQNGRLNYTGIFVLTNLLAGLVVDLLSGSALQLLWNNVLYSAGLFLIYAASLAAGKPLHLYFTLDLMEMRGHKRSITKELFFEKKAFKLFKLITFAYCMNEALYMLCLTHWIRHYGVEAYRLDIVLDKSLEIILSGFSLIVFFFIYQTVDQVSPVKKLTLVKASRKLLSLSGSWISFYLEQAYFYFSHHRR
jgi:hypothetical protein